MAGRNLQKMAFWFSVIAKHNDDENVCSDEIYRIFNLFAETETDLEVPFHRETVLPPSGQLRRVPEKNVLFWSFSYVCPEPVLVK